MKPVQGEPARVALEKSGGAYTKRTASFLSGIFESSDDLFAAIGSDLQLVAFNAAFRQGISEISGTVPQLNQPLDQVLTGFPADTKGVAELCRRAFAGEALHVPMEFVGPGSQHRYFDASFSPVRDSSGVAVVVAVALRDVTDKRVTELKYQGVLEASPDATLVVSKGVIEFANAQLERMFGYAKGALTGMQLERLVPERLRDRHVFQRIEFERQPRTRPMGLGLDLCGVKADGTEFPVEISLSPLDIDGEQLTVAAIRDISARKQVEDELRKESSELRQELVRFQRRRDIPNELEVYRVGFEKAAAALFHYAPDGCIRRANDCFCRLLGFSREELIQLTVQKITHPDDVQVNTDLDLKLMAGALDHYRIDKRFMRKDRTTLWVTLAVSIQRSDRGEPDYLIAVAEDITERKQTEQMLREARLRLGLAAEIARVGYAELDLETKAMFLSPELKRQLGYADDELPNAFSEWSSRLHAEDRARASAAMQSLIDTPQRAIELEYRMRHKDGTYHWFLKRAIALEDVPGHAKKLIFTQIDVTEHRRAEQALQDSERRLALALEAGRSAAWEVDVATRKVLPGDDLLYTMLGYAPGKPDTLDDWLELIHDEDRPYITHMLGDVIGGAQDSYHGVELRYRAQDGSWHWILCQAVVAQRDARGRATRLVGTHTDIHARKIAEEQARKAALHDPLTGLPNRALVFEYGSHLIAAAQRSHGHVTALFIDLDRFKPINDQYGHEIGDRVLQEVARRLTDCTRDEDLVGRLGGDEFVIVLVHQDVGWHGAGAVAQHVVESISGPIQIDGLGLSLSPSVGISYYPEHGNDLEALIRTADLAMYRAKQSGRANYQIYTPELDRQAGEAYRVEARLRDALEHGGLALHYQPVIDVKSGQLISAEALVRLPADDGEAHGPETFIPIAESAGLIGELGEWVAVEACRQHAVWRSEGLTVPVAINISPLQFRQRTFPEMLGSIISDSGIEPEGLQLEITESSVMESDDEAVEILNRIKSLGVKVAIDDFGTGYSSLSRLSRLPLDKLKVDQSFVRGIENDSASRAVTEAILALGHNLQLEVIGEGIESEDALNYLEEHGCDQVQGFWFSEPLPAPAFAQWCRERSR